MSEISLADLAELNKPLSDLDDSVDFARSGLGPASLLSEMVAYSTGRSALPRLLPNITADEIQTFIRGVHEANAKAELYANPKEAAIAPLADRIVGDPFSSRESDWLLNNLDGTPALSKAWSRKAVYLAHDIVALDRLRESLKA